MDNDSQQRGRGVNKHYWTTQEDKALIEALVELSTNTMWRGENGFRNGYLNQLEKMIKEKFPHTTLKAVPNIESRVKLFRTKTTAIEDILSISGFVWNNEHSTIECEKSAYDEYVKNHKEAAGLYGKSFPFFNDLAPVFTKDRAQGNARGDLGDDVDQYMHETINLEDNADFSQFQSEEFFMPMDEPTQPPSPIISDNGASSSTVQKKKKRAKDSDISTISENFLKFVEMVGPGLKTMAECAIRNAESNALKEAAHKEVQEKKKLLNQVIFNINGLSEDEALLVMQSLRKDEEKLNMFWDLPDDKKLRFCHLLLGGRDTM